MNQLLSWSIPSNLVLFTVYLSVCIYSEQNSVCTSAFAMHKYRYIRPCYFLVIHYIDAYIRQAISVSVCLTSQGCISRSYVLNFVTISFSSYLQDAALATYMFSDAATKDYMWFLQWGCHCRSSCSITFQHWTC